MTPLKYLTGKKSNINHGGLNGNVFKFCSENIRNSNHRIAAKFADVNMMVHGLKSLKDTFNADSSVIRYGGDHVNKIDSH
jgi:hypothetical protein